MVSGPPPKPLAIRAVEGDAQKIGARKLREKIAREPKATHGLPACPEHLTGRAAEVWKFWAEELADMGLDRRPDAQMLEGACINYARAVKADLLLEVAGLTVEESTITESGERVVLKIKKHPAVDISNQAWRQVKAFCCEFGLSPASRTRLAVEKKEPQADLAVLLAGPRVSKPAVQ